MSSLNEVLDLIWDSARPCKCGNDDNWEQQISGKIRCTECGDEVVE